MNRGEYIPKPGKNDRKTCLLSFLTEILRNPLVTLKKINSNMMASVAPFTLFFSRLPLLDLMTNPVAHC